MSVDDFGSEAAPLRLDHFLKINSISESGGQAKLMIQGGEVKVNGEIETRRRRKLIAGDVVEAGDEKFVVSESDVNLECSPKPDPYVMRVQRPKLGERTFDERQEALSGADHQETA